MPRRNRKKGNFHPLDRDTSPYRRDVLSVIREVDRDSSEEIAGAL